MQTNQIDVNSKMHVLTKRRKIMKTKKLKTLILRMMIGLLFAPAIFAQGVSRSTGIGFRAGVWNADIGVGVTSGASIRSSFSGSIYFFSRLTGNWYLETSVGGVEKSEINASILETGVSSSSLMPILLGARYDLLSPRYNSLFQPYLSFGAGAYTSTQSVVGTSFENLSAGVSAGSKTKPGAYVGAGVNAVLASFFAINADFKYHAVQKFENSTIDFSGLEFEMGFSFMWGSTPEIFTVEEIKLIVKDIYPAYYQFYNTYPLALVVLKNTSGYPIEVNIKSEIPDYSEREQESGFIRIATGETKDIPVQALFGAKLLQAKQRKPAVLDLKIEARTGATTAKTLSVNLLIHSRNAWNGQIDRLGFFVTPDDEEIMKLSRQIVAATPGSESDELKNIHNAQAIFNKLQQNGLGYQNDPSIPFYKDDYVQFASETLTKNSGDCDDLVVLYSSLLESIGINTSFVEIKDPEKDIAHLFIIFDSGLTAEKGNLISSNEKRYIIRKGSAGENTLWLPVETTLVSEGFDEAWKAGATTYIEDGIIRSGLQKGWVKIINLD